ncbi:glycosyltransferase 61 family protein [Methylobacterium trifolii]|nr:glycosyltransferase 61 family protein [Methylobacterium trifolii]
MFYLRIGARSCWGIIPIPVDRRPPSAEPQHALDGGVWCGFVDLHYGHMIAEFGMRIVQAAYLDPHLPLVFSLPEGFSLPLPSFFWEIIDVLGVARTRLVFVREPLRVRVLHVYPQAERLYGGGPSARHLDLLDRLFGDKVAVEKDIPCAFVSRALVSRGGQIAGESYLEDVLSRLGVLIIHPEKQTVGAQLALYCRVRRLIFSEGSAVHTLQLIGRIDVDVAVLVRRPRRYLAFASLRPRVRALTYLRAVAGLIRGLGASRRTQRHRGVSVLDEAGLLREFQRIGLDLAPHWDTRTYRARRDDDIRAWIALRKSLPQRYDEAEFVDLQLAALAIPVTY